MLDLEFARRLAPSAGLRNRLVHEYEDIDTGMLFDALGRGRSDIPDYIEAVERYVTRIENR